MNIGSALKTIRKELKVTQGQLSEKTGISQTSLSKIESGVNPSANNLKKICNVLGISPSLVYILATDESDIPDVNKTKYTLLFPSIKNLILEIISVDSTLNS